MEVASLYSFNDKKYSVFKKKKKKKSRKIMNVCRATKLWFLYPWAMIVNYLLVMTTISWEPRVTWYGEIFFSEIGV